LEGRSPAAGALCDVWPRVHQRGAAGVALPSTFVCGNDQVSWKIADVSRDQVATRCSAPAVKAHPTPRKLKKP
jgi:hypothetical protein